ncbi:hypothetical protein M406DRAFT_12881, partial [Cryphonectria parasitica EP155]
RSSIRSRLGCLTCKRRKVKCDEQRPRCSHCERLNLECKWHLAIVGQQSVQDSGSSVTLRTPVPESEPPSNGPLFQTPPLHAVNQLFDYASFMWDIGTENVWQQLNPDATTTTPVGVASGMERTTSAPTTDHTSVLAFSDTAVAENHRLMDYFSQAVTPPILADVETQKNWLAMRQILVGMSSSSRMVRWAVLAFSNLMLCRGDGAWMSSQQDHYKNATAEVAACDEQDPRVLSKPGTHRTNLLATLFFLSYIDIIEDRIEAAHSSLKRAHNIFEHGEKDTFTTTEKQFLLWIRLLDARAVSAGGEGLFLSKDEETLLVDAGSPNILKDAVENGKDDIAPGDIEDTLFQVLYQPGIVFFQKVQSFMGRISKIDPWHRSRGTVEDETEVMNMGQAIAVDLRKLYEQRPPLMDIAVAGKLTPPHISAHLSFVVTRAFRTYLSNYYASKIHLHRVVYKAFPLTSEATDALQQIKRLTRLIVEGLDHGDALPVNMLWPLLMLGSEEQDLRERAWIAGQILKMEKVAGNAKITAQVLEEVQLRQDQQKARVDIRSVMHAIFNRCFAIV